MRDHTPIFYVNIITLLTLNFIFSEIKILSRQVFLASKLNLTLLILSLMKVIWKFNLFCFVSGNAGNVIEFNASLRETYSGKGNHKMKYP